MYKQKELDYPDNLLLSITLFLAIFGIVMIYSSSSILAQKYYNNSYMFLLKQIIGLIIGFVVMWYVLQMNMEKFRKFSVFLLLICVLLLIAVLIPPFGKKVNGARRWIDLYFFTIQPSEFTRLILVIYLADVLSRKQNDINDLKKGIIPLMIILGLIFVLVKLEPDMGRLIILGSIAMVMLIVGGFSLKYLLSFIIPVCGLLFYWIRLDPVRWERILSFADPKRDPYGVGYHLSQSLVAVKSGGLMGLGLGNSRQKFFYLPEAHNDFIFAIIGEELGFIGTCIVVVLFGVFIWRGLNIAFKATDFHHGLLATGIITMIGVEAVVHMCVVLGIIPTTGTPLPFISYGVSALVTNMAAVGILLNVSRNNV